MLFTSQIYNEWIKASHVDVDIFHKKILLRKKLEVFLVYLELPGQLETTRKKHLGQYNLFSKDLVEKKLYSRKATIFTRDLTNYGQNA
jgi:hypothetical protein